eukprot:CAMPEP_0194096904 /NCGR_PEP_ID=MMETSP0149-20130528/57587_1 /TAXON_ID=122233 /ORGANISM="Chaetoceros debilis, Strain MM31A-1" /LENGTH=652 /DNA_ID=CAMNT_0038782905 /DNA_START=64 /DNA_END=2019 /DNA_ORIENTATION=+
MTLRNPIKDRKKVQEVFSKYNGTPNVGDNSFIKKSVLASALRDAMGKNISQDFIDRSIATTDASGKDGNPFHKDIGFHEFLLLMQFLHQQMEAPDAQTSNTNGTSNRASLISREKKVKLLNSLSNDLYPLRKLLRIQIDRQDANIKSNGKSHHDDNFVSAYAPDQMSILALVSHNQMKATAKRFVRANKNIIKKFRLIGTNSTMEMLKEVFAGDSDVCYGPPCSSGPLGGDAELGALLTKGKLGAVIFFQDPMNAHPHQADIACLCRLALVHNTPIAHNPTTALVMLNVFRAALKVEGKPELIPSFFFSLMSPSVTAYKAAQKRIIQSFADDASDDSSAESPLRRSAIARALPQDSPKGKRGDKDKEFLFTRNDAASPALKIPDNPVKSPRCVKHIIFPSEINVINEVSCPFDEVSCPSDEYPEKVPVSSEVFGNKIHHHQSVGTESFLSKDNKFASRMAENEEDLFNSPQVFFDKSRDRTGVGTESFLSKDNNYSSNISENGEDLFNSPQVFFDESRDRMGVGTESFLSKDNNHSGNISENGEELIQSLQESPREYLYHQGKDMGFGSESFLSNISVAATAATNPSIFPRPWGKFSPTKSSFRTADTSQSSFTSKINDSDPIVERQNIHQNEKTKKIKIFFVKKNKMSSNS